MNDTNAMNIDTVQLREQAQTTIQGADPGQTLESARALCKADPERWDHQQMAGIAALASDLPQEARERFEAALPLAGAPNFAGATWCGLGRIELDEDNPARAEAAFRRALSLIHEFPPALVGLSEALERKMQYNEAETAGRRALELGHDEPRLHLTLAHACLWLEKIEAAEKEFNITLTLQPTAQAAHFGLGLVAKARGQLDEARRIFLNVLEREPRYAGYVHLASLHDFSADDSMLGILEKRYGELPNDAPPNARSDLAFALAKAWDDAGDAARASRYLDEGNTLQAEQLDYDPAPQEEFMRRLQTLFTREFVKRLEGGGLTDLSPIFITSMPRSGSTLLEQMLASHSQVRGGGELGHFNRIAFALGRQWAAREDFPNVDAKAATENLRAAGREYAKRTAALRLLQPRFTDKTLDSYCYIGMIRTMLPDARILHVRRHPLATALGIYRQRFGNSIGYGFDLEHINRYYRAYWKLMEHWRATLPEAFIDVFYEALVTNPERELRRILAYLDLEFEPACLEFHRLERPVRTASVVQVREPLNTRGLARHERYGELLAPVAEGLAEEIAAYESELDEVLHAH